MRINNEVKNNILFNVRAFFEKEYVTNNLGLELKEVEDRLTSECIRIIDEVYTPDALYILERFGFCSNLGTLYVNVNNGVVGFKGFSSGGSADFTGVSSKRIAYGSSNEKAVLERFRAEISEDDWKLFFTIKTRIKCEINDLVYAYAERIKSGGSLEKLGKTFPDMLQFIPKEYFSERKGKIISNTKRGEIIISEFFKEKETKKEENHE